MVTMRPDPGVRSDAREQDRTLKHAQALLARAASSWADCKASDAGLHLQASVDHAVAALQVRCSSASILPHPLPSLPTPRFNDQQHDTTVSTGQQGLGCRA